MLVIVTLAGSAGKELGVSGIICPFFKFAPLLHLDKLLAEKAVMALLARAHELAPLLQRGYACCYLCLSELAAGFVTDLGALDEARLEAHQFWTACMSAITHGSTAKEYRHVEANAEKQRRNLRAALAACTRHDPPPPGPEFDILHEFVSAASACLHVSLTCGPLSAVHRAAHSKRPIENKAGVWPDLREVLFYFGEANTVFAMMVWCCQIGAPSPMLLLADLVRIAHPLVVHRMLERNSLRRQLMLAVARRVSEFLAWKVGRESSWGDAPVPPTAPRRRRAGMRAANALLESVCSSPDALPNLLLLLTNEYEAPLFGTLNQALVVMQYADDSDMEPDDDDGENAEDDDDLARSIALVASSLYAVILSPKETLCEPLEEIVASYGGLTLFDVLHEQLGRCTSVRRLCYTCGRAAHKQDVEGEDDKDTHFRACGRCKVMRYCGRDCQLSGWKTGDPTPHRAVCALLARIRAVANSEMPRSEFSAALSALEFTQEELRALSLFTLNPKLVPVHALFRAADIHRELFSGGPYPPTSSTALANVSALKKMVVARRAGRDYDIKKLFSIIAFE